MEHGEKLFIFIRTIKFYDNLSIVSTLELHFEVSQLEVYLSLA